MGKGVDMAVILGLLGVWVFGLLFLPATDWWNRRS